MLKPLTAADVEFAVETMPEDADYRGHCSHEGCEDCHQWIEDQLCKGNDWAWCCVRVVARWNGFQGDDYLGCCSYESHEQFTHPGGYFPDMKERALALLNEEVADADRAIATIRL